MRLPRRPMLPVAIVLALTGTGCANIGAPASGSPPPITGCPPGQNLVCRSKDPDRFPKTNVSFCTCETAPGLP